ncbi:MAG TPA: signal peptidase I [Deltaproteobacteria bacterium]|nr:signal peptidase I [Deltaproteobacteria bacterium]
MSTVKQKSSIRDWAEALVVAFVIAMVIRAFVLQAYRIPSSSMEDTLLKGDHILATKYNYGLTIPFTTYKFWGKDRVPKRGDIVIFTFPGNHAMDFVKRVIGVPGDTIEVREKKVYINGQPYQQPFEKHTDPFILTQGQGMVRDNFGPIRVDPGNCFVMGDNRDQSYDSRFWGFVPIQNIKGKAFVIYFSWDGSKHWIRLSRIGHLIH